MKVHLHHDQLRISTPEKRLSSAPVEEGLEPDANHVDESVRESGVSQEQDEVQPNQHVDETVRKSGVSQEQVEVQPNQDHESGTFKRQRGHSERITKLKLKRKVTTADGSGDIEEHPISFLYTWEHI
ncbi:hypothetical protein L1887_09858 [Cichorium endivia]|nr:hypothetical protein L1887_09858 [Cichorium endivia]